MSIQAQDSGQSPGGFLQWVERIGNKIPNPFLLFVYLIALLMVASTELHSSAGTLFSSPIWAR